MKRDDPVYGELRVKLPRFIIIGLRVMVSDVNAKDPEGERWTVSILLEKFLMRCADGEVAVIGDGQEANQWSL